MKRFSKTHFILLLLIVLVFSASSQSYASSVRVTVPSFKVTLNGVEVDNTYNKYPLISYKDITYFPLTYRHANFLGLKTSLNQERKIYFVGLDNHRTDEFKTYETNVRNQGYYTASIPDYEFGINQTTDLIKNTEATYPFLKFRDIIYFPFTWRNAKEIFGWEYNWSQERGLVIDSRNTERPVVDESIIHSQSPSRGLIGGQYIYASDFYIRYPKSTLNENYEFTYKKDGEEIEKFSLKDGLTGADFYFNTQATKDGYIRQDPVLKPSVEGIIFKLPSVRRAPMAGKNTLSTENVIIEIDLNKKEIVNIKGV